MFERNRIDNNTSATGHQTTAAAVVALADGEILTGHFVYSAARAFSDLLNGELLFLEFTPLNGNRRFLAKHAIRSVTMPDAPAATALESRRPKNGEFDPYTALGLSRDAEWDEVREAYLRLSKSYHPDRFASVDMPVEVRDYLAQMSKRVNAAYTMLESARIVVKKAVMRPAPVYTSRPRA